MLPINAICQGDVLDRMMDIDTDSVDLIVTSPKYNLGVGYDVCEDHLSWPEYYDWCRKWLKECYRVLKPDGRFCLNHYLSCGTAKARSNPLMNLNGICVDIGFKEHGLVVWDESTQTKRQAWGSWMQANAPYVNQPLEGISVFYKDHWKKDRKGESTITREEFMNWTLGIWTMAPERSRGGCPAPFPQELPRRCIRLLSFKDDLVLDPFNGSGTTTFVAKQEGRHFIGIDISGSYCQDAREWIETGVKPARPAMKRIDKHKKLKADVLTKRCGCGEIIDIGAAMCRSCREKKRIEKRSEDAMGCHRGLIR